MSVRAAGVAGALARRLADWRDADGGWGYYPGKASRLEPTSQALLALTVAAPGSVDRLPPRLADAEGLLNDDGADAPNFAANAQAVLALLAVGAERPARRIAAQLVAAKGLAFPIIKGFPEDPTIQAWPWRDGTTSWVEPTAWCLLALQQIQRRWPAADVADRLVTGERLLADRACVGGGWNTGNTVLFRHNLHAYVPVTAVALLALRNHRPSRFVEESLAWLDAHRLAEPAGLALALARLALTAYERPSDDVEGLLMAVGERTAFMENIMVTALAVSALAAPAHGLGVFRV